MPSKNETSTKPNVALLFAEADWEALVELSEEQLARGADGGQEFVYVACAHQQLGQEKEAKHFVEKGLAHGCSIGDSARILVAGAHQSLGRLLLLRKRKDEAEAHFLTAQQEAKTDSHPLQAHDIAVREMIRLGLLSDASDKISANVWKLKNLATPKEIDTRVTMLRTELAILTEELSHALQRNQLYRSSNSLQATQSSVESQSLSQLGQDLWALKTCNNKRSGFFVEFGATDGVTLSNTYLLEKEFDWNGLLAEPNPKFLQELKKNRETTVTDACIGATTGENVEFIFADVFGGMTKHADDDKHGSHRRAYKDAGQITQLTTISLNDFLEKYGAPREIDYISVDTEGSEYEILKEFPFEKWGVRCWTVEHNYAPIREKIHTLFTSHGYTRTEAQWDDWYYR